MLKDKSYIGRRLITTSRKITGNSEEDSNTIKQILKECLPIHQKNVADIDMLFRIYFNDPTYWTKEKKQRSDINNKITVADAWAISRTINFYCFGEPIKYVSRNTSEDGVKQTQVELLSEFLDYQHNHDSTTMATLCSSICGLGYKLVLPANKDEYNFSGIPFVINSNVLYPQNNFCVYASDITGEKVLGVSIGSYYDENNKPDGKLYTVWTKYHQYLLKESSKDSSGFEVIPYVIDGKDFYGEQTFIGRIPLIEVERNAFRKGDWEICLDLLTLKNKLASMRTDDVQQVIDYVMLLINCEFETEEDKKNALNDRVFQLVQKNTTNKPDVQILKNPLDQNGIQVFADYLDGLIETTAGIPSRAERGGGGHDTGRAVIYRNGYRDLENNAGMIIPKMDKAETEFVGVCIAYSHNLSAGKDKLDRINPYDIRNKFVRSLSDDPITASQAYSTFRSAGMNDIDSLIASRAVTDPAEVHKNNLSENKKDIDNTDKLI